mmetsp:Transcript_32513/g.74750  ORF Transcript_32513/g.74750 Transcript_32513/m.74750 type:complete len:163 (-) Transcript_32513:1250-1738(-)
MTRHYASLIHVGMSGTSIVNTVSLAQGLEGAIQACDIPGSKEAVPSGNVASLGGTFQRAVHINGCCSWIVCNKIGLPEVAANFGLHFLCDQMSTAPSDSFTLLLHPFSSLKRTRWERQSAPCLGKQKSGSENIMMLLPFFVERKSRNETVLMPPFLSTNRNS